jgi:hypothetical protein
MFPFAKDGRSYSPFGKGGFRGIFPTGCHPGQRLAYLMVVALLLAALGCSAAAPAPTAAPEAPPAGMTGSPQFSAILVTNDLAVGTNRVSFGLVDLEGRPLRTPQAQVEAVYYAPGNDEGEARQTATAEFLPWPPPGQRGVYITTLDFDEPGDGTAGQPGLWVLKITTTAEDGSVVEAQTAARVGETTSTPGIGAAVPRSETPTVRDVPDLYHISTAHPPDPDLYQMSIAQALDQGKPLVVVFATPAFCVSATCGPQVEVISQVKERHQGEVNFVHVEVYRDPHLMEGTPSFDKLAPAVHEWGLLSEPWTFIIDREGRLHAKYEQFTPADEIERALQEVQ